MRRFLAFSLPLILAGCATTGGTPGDQAKNLTCLAARIELQRCAAGAETDRDLCLYAEIVAAGCDAATPEALAAALTPGTGYAPRSTTSYFRRIPGGREESAQGSLAADPWSVQCAGKSGADFAACIRSRFLTVRPEVCAEWARAFGVDSCGIPGGGWSRGPGNERWGASIAALQYFCENDPAVIGSPGRAGGLDCLPLAVEWTRLGAFAGEPIVAEWQRRTQAPPAPICGNGIKESGESCATCPVDIPNCPFCGNHRPDPGETCSSCPVDLGPCPDGKLDCSGLQIPAPDAPQFVAAAPREGSTGLADVKWLPCRGGTVSPPAPEPPVAPTCIPAKVRQTAKDCATWTAIRWRKERCARLMEWASGLPTC